jgi:hypothetical protein
MTKTNIQQILYYTPFNFCSFIILKISNLKNITKRIIITIIIFILFLIPTSFSIYNLYFNDDDNDYGKEDNIFLKFCNIYEKNIFALCFSLLIIFLIASDDDSLISKIINSNLFFVFERINFEYFCTIEFIVYINFTVFHYNLTLTYQNLFYTTIGFVIFANIINIFLMVLLELPLRKFTKAYIKYYTKNLDLKKSYSFSVSTVSNELNDASSNSSKKIK